VIWAETTAEVVDGSIQAGGGRFPEALAAIVGESCTAELHPGPNTGRPPRRQMGLAAGGESGACPLTPKRKIGGRLGNPSPALSHPAAGERHAAPGSSKPAPDSLENLEGRWPRVNRWPSLWLPLRRMDIKEIRVAAWATRH